jgi:integrase
MENVSVSTRQNGLMVFDEHQEKILTDGDSVIKSYIDTLKSPYTKRNYTKSIYGFYEYVFGKRKLTFDDIVCIRPHHAYAYEQKWKKQLDEKIIKISTYNCKLKGLKEFYKWLMNILCAYEQTRELILVNPFGNIRQHAENDAEGCDALEPEEVELMLNNPVGHNFHTQERNRLILELAVGTGIRNNALITAKIENIKYKDGNYLIEVTDKENKTHSKSIEKALYDRLTIWYNNDIKTRIGNDGTIFDIHPVSANRIIREWAKSLGIDKHITFHSLRATCAILIYYTNGGNAYEVQEYLGHSHLVTTKTYLKKRNKIATNGQRAMEVLHKSNKFYTEIAEMSKEDLVKMIMSLDSADKMKLLSNI